MNWGSILEMQWARFQVTLQAGIAVALHTLEPNAASYISEVSMQVWLRMQNNQKGVGAQLPTGFYGEELADVIASKGSCLSATCNKGKAISLQSPHLPICPSNVLQQQSKG